MLLYSACSEISHAPHFEQPVPGAQDYLKDFNFCHTFQGSFGFEVTSEIVRKRQDQELFQLPVNRRMVERIARGLIALKRAIKNDDPDILISAHDEAFNARMCDSLSQIGLDGEVTFGININWATIIPPAQKLTSLSNVIIEKPEMQMLSFVSEKLKAV